MAWPEDRGWRDLDHEDAALRHGALSHKRKGKDREREKRRQRAQEQASARAQEEEAEAGPDDVAEA